MRQIFFFLACIFASISAFAQLGNIEAKNLEKIKKSTAYIIIDDSDTDFNKDIKEAAKKWTFTKYEFIVPSQYETMKLDESKVFISKVKYSYGFVNPTVHNNFLAIFFGGKKPGEDLIKETICFITMDFTAEYNEGKYGLALIMLHNFLKERYDLKDSKDSYVSVKSYQKKSGTLKGKTLLVDKKYFGKEITSPEDMKAVYGYTVKAVSTKEIQAAIYGDNKDEFILFPVYNLGRINISAVNAGTGEIVYFDWPPIVVSSADEVIRLRKADIKKMAKRISKS